VPSVTTLGYSVPRLRRCIAIHTGIAIHAADNPERELPIDSGELLQRITVENYRRKIQIDLN
jgi:hypothetical protein